MHEKHMMDIRCAVCGDFGLSGGAISRRKDHKEVGRGAARIANQATPIPASILEDQEETEAEEGSGWNLGTQLTAPTLFPHQSHLDTKDEGDEGPTPWPPQVGQGQLDSIMVRRQETTASLREAAPLAVGRP